MDKKKRRFRIIAITKTDKGTYTDNNTKLVDHCTMTSAIWNPVLDRRDKSIALVKNRALTVKARLKRRKTKTQSVSTDGKVVTFRSSTQIIPSGPSTCHLYAVGRYTLNYTGYLKRLLLKTTSVASGSPCGR